MLHVTYAVFRGLYVCVEIHLHGLEKGSQNLLTALYLADSEYRIKIDYVFSVLYQVPNKST